VLTVSRQRIAIILQLEIPFIKLRRGPLLPLMSHSEVTPYIHRYRLAHYGKTLHHPRNRCVALRCGPVRCETPHEAFTPDESHCVALPHGTAVRRAVPHGAASGVNELLG